MFRAALRLDAVSSRFALAMLMVTILLVLTITGTNAAETIGTPSAVEYTMATVPAASAEPAASTAGDLRLVTGFSIAAVLVLATVVLTDRRATDVSGLEPDLVPVAQWEPTRLPTPIDLPTTPMAA